MLSEGLFEAQTPEQIEQMVKVSGVQKVYLTKVLTGQLIERFETIGIKPALVITTSTASFFPCPGFLTYSAVKQLAAFLAEGLRIELAGKVEVMNYSPGNVATKLISKTKADSITNMPDRAVQACFRDLGYEPWTRGTKKHDFWLFLYRCLSTSRFQAMAYKKCLQQAQRKLEAN